MMKSLLRRSGALVACLGLSATAALSAARPATADTDQYAAARSRTVLTEYKVASLDPGIELYVRERRLRNKTKFSSKKVVLFLEPFGLPSAEAFDVPGYSWMEERALAGYDTWTMDFRGFGKSTRPAEMNVPPTNTTPPLTSTPEAERDVHAVIDFIQSKRGRKPINLVGWSWGGVVAGAYAADNPGNVAKLVLDGSMHAFNLPMMTQPMESAPLTPNPMMNYQLAEWSKTTMMHWTKQMAGRPLATMEAMDAVKRVFEGADATSTTRTPTSIRRAMGPMGELYWIWSNKATYDAAKVKAPVLVISGDSDFFADPSLLRSLVNSPDKREVVIKDATHWALFETHRDVLLKETADFLAR